MKKSVREVSEISKSFDVNGHFNYGFTITYSDGEFKNIIYSSERDDENAALKALESERKNCLKQVESIKNKRKSRRKI